MSSLNLQSVTINLAFPMRDIEIYAKAKGWKKFQQIVVNEAEVLANQKAIVNNSTGKEIPIVEPVVEERLNKETALLFAKNKMGLVLVDHITEVGVSAITEGDRQEINVKIEKFEGNVRKGVSVK